MAEIKVRRLSGDMPDTVLNCIMPYVTEQKVRVTVSLVCRRWCKVEGLTRRHVTIALCYTTTPERLHNRFPHIESLKIKGKPRAAMFNLTPEDWGGYVEPWIREISRSFDCLRFLHCRRMIVTDSDLDLLARTRGPKLEVLKLDKCSRFSTNGLLHIAHYCTTLRTLFLEESMIEEFDGKWLHELALKHTVLETLNFYMTELEKFDFMDLELLARNCRSLVSVKVSECDLLSLQNFFRVASSLREFCGGAFNLQSSYADMVLPTRFYQLGLTYLGSQELDLIFPFSVSLKKLDLLYALLNTEDHYLLIQGCPNLEVLEARNVIGDRGLEALAEYCKKLKRLRIERGDDEQEMEDEEGLVTQRGLIALSQGCLDLEYLAVYASDITNLSLESIGTHMKNLSDFRLVLLERQERITDLPLDNGVRALLRGCNQKLKRFALYLRPGGLTDVGLGYIGQYSPNVRWMLLGCVGETDGGLLAFSRGCPSLQKLEMRGCSFTERALAVAATQLTALRYLWVQGYISSAGQDLLAMARPFWNIELIPPRQVTFTDQNGEKIIEHPAQILAYYSLAGPRSDFPDSVIPLGPPMQMEA